MHVLFGVSLVAWFWRIDRIACDVPLQKVCPPMETSTHHCNWHQQNEGDWFLYRSNTCASPHVPVRRLHCTCSVFHCLSAIMRSCDINAYGILTLGMILVKLFWDEKSIFLNKWLTKILVTLQGHINIFVWKKTEASNVSSNEEGTWT